jgi:hypothetical protein
VCVESQRVVCSIITKAWSNLIHDNIFKSFLNQHIALEIELNDMVIGLCGLRGVASHSRVTNTLSSIANNVSINYTEVKRVQQIMAAQF